jgi:hypothetical protein
MLNGQIEGTIQTMRKVVDSLRQSEQNNSNLAQQLFQQEVSEAADLNNNIGNVPEMAQRDKKAANILHQFADVEKNAVQQLDLLDKMLVDLQKQLT